MEPSKSTFSRIYTWLSPAVFLSSNPISLTGVVLVTSATILWMFLLPTLIRNETRNPYVGIPAFLLLPGVFIFGLILIPIGIAWQRSRRRRAGLPSTFAKLDWNSVELRRLFLFVAAATVVNVIVVAQWGYSAVNYMDSSAFCGLTCHKVMQPEYTAFLSSPHARVECAGCHIGAGASWFVKSKLSGVGQVFAVAFNSYPRPIPSPVENLRPARETCEHCHWPQRFSGDLFKVKTSYAPDEQNQETSTVLLLKIGGNTWRGGVGIHGVHVEDKSKIEYVTTDRRRQDIPQVTYTARDGSVTVYKSTESKATAQDLARGTSRTMDCMDCHNRPSHSFQLPERAVDQAMAQHQISSQLPFIKREAVAALRHEYLDRDTASREIPATIENFYKTNYPQLLQSNSGDIKNAGTAIQGIYLQNIFPDMKITWGTYPNNVGHTDSPGCFRCHDGNHVSSSGKAIPNDCTTCHEMPAMDEKNPKILTELGYQTAQP